ncbi:hypothetical protein TNCV_3137801 [Trichonephila clavipes]|nr:hypothetical protein TNCV_3137801 [Trichonephila clavipes]
MIKYNTSVDRARERTSEQPHIPLRPNPHDREDAISNKIPQNIKVDHLKFKLELVEALAASGPTNKSIFTEDEVNSVVIPLAKRFKCYNPPAIPFILTIPGQKA